ncbi:MAG: YfiR family protein [Deltaproteobacteria bacterium]|nr:YfiR family protein [Deltaproteobacteria bacterium]
MITSAPNCTGKLRLRLLFLAMLALLGPLEGATQNRPVSREYQLKAAILYKFVGFIEWENNESQVDGKPDIEICIIGTSPFGSALERMASLEPIQTKHIIVRTSLRAEEAGSCDLAFISSSEAANLPRILAEMAPRPCVTVSDIPRFAELGGTIELFREGQFIRFNINTSQMREKGVRLSSQLLALAKQVIGNE